MRISTFLSALFCILLILTTPVLAVECAFINITTGAQGIQGIQGIPGEMNQTINQTPGAEGLAATLDINATFTVAEGSPATVTNIGTTSVALFDIEIPIGATGATGSTGDMNQTINLTPGTPGINGLDNMTANMTAGDKGDKGDTGDIPDSSQFLFLNGTRAMTGIFNVGGFNLTNLLNPVGAQDATTLAYEDARPVINSSYLTSSSLTSYDTISNQSSVTSLLATTANLSSTNQTIQGQLTLKDTIANVSQNLNLKETISNTSAINQSIQTQLSAKETISNTSVQLNLKDTIANVSSTNTAINNSIISNTSMYHAPLVSGKVPTVNLGGAGADNTKYLRGDQSWQVPAGGAGLGYTLYVSHLTSSPADAVKNYWGMNPLALTTSAGVRKVPIPATGTISEVHVAQNSGTAGTAEAYDLYVYKNGVINNSTGFVGRVSASASIRLWDNTTMALAVTKGDYIEMCFVNPTWATNPLTTISNGFLYIS